MIASAVIAAAALALLAAPPLLIARRLREQARQPVAHSDLVDTIEAIQRILPQTQCGQCGFAGCRPYAQALAQGDADIDRCPPGGAEGARALARLLGREPKPVNPANGVEKPVLVALIREAECIGCTKCIQACPVDAIIGGPKLMHTVLPALCTGCELCIPPCPVDCIDLVPPRMVPEGR